MENDFVKNIIDTFKTNSNTKVTYLNSPVKSKCDKKEYRVIKLENGLIALLISDFVATVTNECKENTKHNFGEKMAACGLTVNVGSFSDPPRIQGLAHFLEHVITMGSEKYPEENEYAKFVKKRGGSLMADTGNERTKYIFQIHPDHLLPAMDRFADFFINPLLKKEAILRERESIDNEFHLDSASDYDRLKKFFRIIPKPNHPASKFSCGNLVTLRNNISEEELYSELIAFKNRHYTAKQMTLAVQATLSLNTLETYVKECFSRLTANHLSPCDFTKFIGFDAFDSLKLRKIYTVKSVNDCHEMELKWILPPSKHSYRNKPIHYICHLLNYEARGSLSHYLRENKLCDRLSVNREQYSLFTVLTVNLVLPHRNKNHRACTKKILEAVFSYVNTMRQASRDLRRRIFEELQSIAEYKFDHADEINAASNVQALCCNMQCYPATDFLTGNELYFEFDDREIKIFLDNLTPNNVFIVILNNKRISDEDFNEMETWYKIRYFSEEMMDEWIRKLEIIESYPELCLPGPNPFFVTNFRTIDQTIEVTKFPVKIETDAGKIEIWYKPNLTFGLPHSYAYVHLITPCPANSLETCLMSRLFEILIHELFLEDLYNAKIAGLTYNIAANGDGILIKVNGFSEKVPVLLKILVKFVADFVTLVKEDIFDLVKNELLTYYSSILYDPGTLASEISLSFLESHIWTSSEKYSALVTIKFNDFICYARTLSNPFKVQCLVQGNVSKKDSIAIVKEAVEPLKFSPSFTNESWNLTNSYQRLPTNEKFYKVKNLNASDVNSVVMNHYKTNVNYSSVLNLPIFGEFLAMLMQEPLFHQLRTKEQLGYSLSIFTTPSTGFNITIYSPTIKFTTEYIDERIDCFVRSFIVSLNQMSKIEFDARIKDFVKVKKCEDVNLRDELERNWFAITTGSSIFDEREEQVSIMKSLTIHEFHRWINILINNKSFKLLSIQVVGNV